MEELKTILMLLNDLWKFIKKYQGIPLSDKVCEELRKEQEFLADKYKGSGNVSRLAKDLIVAVLEYLLKDDRRKNKRCCAGS